MSDFKAKRAIPVSKINVGGDLVQFYKVPVRVVTDCPETDFLENEVFEFEVVAEGAADAANWVRDNCRIPPLTRISAKGPKGGTIERFVGYDSWVMQNLSDYRGRLGLDDAARTDDNIAIGTQDL